MIIGITGANGYLGATLASRLKAAGHSTVLMTRSKPAMESVEWIPFELNVPVSERDLSRLEVFIHAAWDMGAIHWSDQCDTNISGSLQILEAARNAKVPKIIFISSMSSFDGCQSLYGKAKFEVEKWCLANGCAVVRPGLIYGAESKGVFGAMSKAVERLPIVPQIGCGRFYQYLLPEDDLCAFFLELVEGRINSLERPVLLANPRPVNLREILDFLGKVHQKKRIFLPVPSSLVLLGLRLIEGLGLKAPIRSDSLLGLLHPNPHPRFEFQSFGFKDIKDFKTSTFL